MAEPHATWKFEGDGYRNFGRCFLSTVGFGTYLGEADDETDARYSESLERAFELGCNVVDTAINYRHQRSERVVGEVLDGGSVNDDEVFVSTKGGYIPFRLDVPDDPKRFITEEYIEPGLVSPEDVVDANCITPEFLENQIGRSLENLRRDSVDLYYVHNPETHLKVMEPEEFESLLTDVFVMLERKVGDSIGSYGVATWDGLRAREEETKHISLESLVETAEEAAEEVGNDENSFDAVQMPYNANMTEAYTRKNQRVRGEEMSALEAAEELGVYVFSSASLMQGELARRGNERLDAVEGFDTDAQRAVEFARSAPGMGTSLVGMSSVEHVDENLEVLDEKPVTEEYDEIWD